MAFESNFHYNECWSDNNLPRRVSQIHNLEIGSDSVVVTCYAIWKKKKKKKSLITNNAAQNICLNGKSAWNGANQMVTQYKNF